MLSWIYDTATIIVYVDGWKLLLQCVNPFVPNASFLYLLETSEMLPSQPYGFLMFSGGRKRVHWEQMGLR